MDFDEDEYGDIADDDLIGILEESSQVLPPLPPPRRSKSNRNDDAASTGSDDDRETRPRKRYKVHVGRPVPESRIIGATQAEALPNSSPSRIRGPIYMRPRVDVSPPAPRRPLASIQKMTSFFRPAEPVPRADNTTRDAHNEEVLNVMLDESFGSRLDESSFLSSEVLFSQQAAATRERMAAPRGSFQQTTLLGGRTPGEPTASQAARKTSNYKVHQAPEPLTHHILDYEALQTWVYPTNLGAIRDYQYTIVNNGLYNNLLVALPTGLGKTFIAATIMLNFFRWTKDAQIVFVAPTKPLVAQQVTACFNIAGISRSTTSMLTGEQQPALRAEEWAEKRVFFMTPQTLENDLKTGIADPKKLVLLVVDEAHRATGNYAYVRVVSFLRRFNQSFRVLALTATPGSSVEQVQAVIDALEIAKIDIRTEDSIDIRQFVHQRKIDEITLDPSEEIVLVKEMLAKALQPLVTQLCAQNAYYNRDPMSLTAYGLMQAQQSWLKSDAGKRANQGLKGMMRAMFSTLASVAHSIKLLNYHGIGPFYSSIKDFRAPAEEGNKGGKYRQQIVKSPDFVKMMDMIRAWLNRDGFVGHPKLVYLCDTVLNHFLDAGEGRLAEGAPPSSTRIIVFAEFRDSAEDIARVLNRHGPMVRASVFVGQADSARSAGMNQAKQLETINQFKKGIFNVIVATSIGEEGLDIGQVDLIVCYDASSSPIRMLQRMGRTGRKRAGNIVCLLMRGKEEDNFHKSKHNYEEMQKMISSGERFAFRHDLSRRIVPKEVRPVVDKRNVEIPVENTQDTSLPEPRRRQSKKKMPPKKFHMPDGVETGFRKASKVAQGSEVATTEHAEPRLDEVPLAIIPSVEEVMLTPQQRYELSLRYNRDGSNAGVELDVEPIDLAKHPVSQRNLLPTGAVPHGAYTKRCVKLFRKLSSMQSIEERYVRPYGNHDPQAYLQKEVDNLIYPADDSSDLESPAQLCARVNPKQTGVERSKAERPKVKRSKVQRSREAQVRDTQPKVTLPSKPRTTKTKRAQALLFDDGMAMTSDDDVPQHELTQTQVPSSEGPGDEIVEDEVRSMDDDDEDIGSLRDFLASEGNVSALQSSYTSTTPVSATKLTTRTSTTSTPMVASRSRDVFETEASSDSGGPAKHQRRSGPTRNDDPQVVRRRRRQLIEDDDSDE